MKQYFLLAVLFLSVSFNSHFAMASNKDSSNDIDLSEEIELTENQVPDTDVKVTENNEFIEIRVGKNSVFAIEKEPDLDRMKTALGLELPEELKLQLLAQGQPVPDINPLEGYEKLSELKKQEFLNRRLFFLNAMARFLNSTKFAIGIGSLVGSQLSFIKNKITFKKDVTWEKRSIKERSQKSINGMLQSLDYKLWSQAPLVVDSNEFGLLGSAAPMGVTGFRKNGKAIFEELGFAIAFNSETKALIVEMFHATENFKESLAAVGVVGLNFKFGIMMRNNPADLNLMKITGKSFYPPMVPGFNSESGEFFTAGPSTSLGFPPPPLADMLTWQNTFERNTLVQFRLSLLTKGYVRIYLGNWGRVGQIIILRFKDLFDFLHNQYKYLHAPRCARILR